MTKKYIDTATLFQIRDFMEHGNLYRYQQSRVAGLIEEVLATDDNHLDQWFSNRIRYIATLETEIAKLSHDVNNGLIDFNAVTDRLNRLVVNTIEASSVKGQYLNGME